MAEFLTRRRFGNAVNVCSAGIRPGKPEDAKDAIETLREYFDLNASEHTPRDVKALNLEAFDHVVALDKDVAKKLKTITKREIIVWQIDDPLGDDLLVYKQRALEIMQLVGRLILCEGISPSPTGIRIEDKTARRNDCGDRFGD